MTLIAMEQKGPTIPSTGAAARATVIQPPDRDKRGSSLRTSTVSRHQLNVLSQSAPEKLFPVLSGAGCFPSPTDTSFSQPQDLKEM